jgi:hypothetical protein
MLVDGIKLFEGSSISNASVETGTTFPTTANAGELFFKTTDSLLYVYTGSAWASTGSGGGSSAASALTGTTLASNVVSSSLTSVGTLGSLVVTGTHTQTGALNLVGTTSPLQLQGSAGTSGQVLTSAGTGATPTWQTAGAAASALTGTTLASNVVASSLTSVGELTGLVLNNAASSTYQYIRSATTADVVLKMQNSSSGFTATNGLELMVWGATQPGCAQLINYNTGWLRFGVGGGEQFRIGPTGAFGLNGANYGTAGQVITSAGPSAAPTWGSPSVAGSALTGTSLASNVVSSSLTSVGTLSTLYINGTSATALLVDNPSGPMVTAIRSLGTASTTSANLDFRLQNSTTGFGASQGFAMYLYGVDGHIALWNNFASDMNFATSGTERFRITAAGGFSVGNGGASYGTSGQVLTSNGNTSPSWAAPIAAAGTLTGTTLASNVVTSSLTSVGTLGSLTVTGNVTAADPTVSTHLATKSYVDTAINGLTWKNAVGAATTANISLTGVQTIDGVSVTAGTRVLVKDQTTATQNGIYVAAAGSWTRSTDMDGAPSVGEVNGAAVYVVAGTINGSTSWTQTATITTVGSQAMVFAQFAAGGTTNASTLLGTTLAANVVSSSLTSVGTLGSLTVTGAASAGSFSGAGTGLTGTASGLSIGGNAATATTASAVAGSALTGTSLASNIVSSSLTSVGNLTSLTVAGGTVLGGSTVQVGSSGTVGAVAASTIALADWSTAGTNQLRYVLNHSGAGVMGLGGNNSSMFLGQATTPGNLSPAQWLTVTSSLVTVPSALNVVGNIQLNGSTGTAGQVLASNGASAPTWQTNSVAGSALTGTSLASTIVSSSLTSVGTLTSLSTGLITGNAGATFTTSPLNSVPLAGSGGALQVGVINGSITSVQDCFVGWTTTSSTFNVGNGNGTLVLASRNSGSCGVSIATGGANRLYIESNGGWGLGGANYGTSGQVITSNGTGAAPTWQTIGVAASALTGTTLAATVVSSSLTSVAAAATVGGIEIGYRNLPRVTTFDSTARGKRVALSVGTNIPGTSYSDGVSIAVGDIVSFYNNTGGTVTLTAAANATGTAGTVPTMYKDGTAASVTSVSLAARGSCTIWYNTATEVVVGGSIA